MGFLELMMIAIGLSMDAFAVALCKGLNMRRFQAKQAFLIAFFFGGFQALMPLIGWLLGKQFEAYITAFDHWIAFALLALIGSKMILEAIRGEEEEDTCDDRLDVKELTIMAIATSIDALAIGVTFAFLQVQIVPSVLLIGATTLLLSFAGVAAGNTFGSRLMKKAEIAGGVILILIGLKILIEHLTI